MRDINATLSILRMQLMQCEKRSENTASDLGAWAAAIYHLDIIVKCLNKVSNHKYWPVPAEWCDWIQQHGSKRLKTLLEEGIELTDVYRDELRAWIRPQLPTDWYLQDDYIGEKLTEPRNSTDDDLRILNDAREDFYDERYAGVIEVRPVLKCTCVTNPAWSDMTVPKVKTPFHWCGSVAVSSVHGETVMFGVPLEYIKQP